MRKIYWISAVPSGRGPVEHSYSVTIDRDSVCAGDDSEPHETRIQLPKSAKISDLLDYVKNQHYLASIIGGKATWLIEVGQSSKLTIGVSAQQWDLPRLIIPEETPLSTLFAHREPTVYFRYWLQTDPDSVFACLQSGRDLPHRE